MELDLARLPALPQSDTVAWLAPRVWRTPGVLGIWLGGSLASGHGDQYSDIDLRAAVASNDLYAWATLDLPGIFETTVLGRQFTRLGEDALLHHLILSNGDILDFLVQSITHDLIAERVLLLACRDDALAARLAAWDAESATSHCPVDPAAVRQLLVDFWTNSHKHRKVLHRGLDLMFPSGAYANWTMLMRLWYISVTGEDTTPQHFSGIHGLTTLVHAVQAAEGPRVLADLGMPTRNRDEIRAAIVRHREIAAHLGRALALRYDFAYPSDLEAMVMHAWEQFLAEQPSPQRGVQGEIRG
jgi:hypothetical protein